MQSEGVKDENEDGRRERKEWILIIAIIILSSSPPLFGPTIASFFSHFLSSLLFCHQQLYNFLPPLSPPLSPSKIVDGIIITRSTWDVITELWWWWHLRGKKEWKWEKRNDWKIIWDFEERLFFFSSWVATYFDSTFSILLFIHSFLWYKSFFSAPQVIEIVIRRGDHTIHTPLSSHGTHISLIPFKGNDFRNKKYLKIYQLQCIL